MSSLAKKIKRAESMDVVDDCLLELKALIALCGKRIQELEAEEVDRRLTEIMPPEINDLG
jgi:hypothetical protein